MLPEKSTLIPLLKDGRFHGNGLSVAPKAILK